MIVQKYIHDLQAWNALPAEAQEKVIGRTKLSDIELDDAVKPLDSHVALNTIVGPNGAQRQILRDNMPFGSAGQGEFGTSAGSTSLPGCPGCWQSRTPRTPPGPRRTRSAGRRP